MNEVDEMDETNTLGEPTGRVHAALREIKTGHLAAQPVRDPTRRTAQAATHVENGVAGANVCQRRQRFGGLETTVMILIEVLELVFGEGFEVKALCRNLRENFVLVDRMRVVVVHQPRGMGHARARWLCHFAFCVEAVAVQEPVKTANRARRSDLSVYSGRFRRR